MASDTDFDVSQLSADEQQVLQQYLDVTGQSVKDAVPLLERSQWNVQVSGILPGAGEHPETHGSCR